MQWSKTKGRTATGTNRGIEIVAVRGPVRVAVSEWGLAVNGRTSWDGQVIVEYAPQEVSARERRVLVVAERDVVHLLSAVQAAYEHLQKL